MPEQFRSGDAPDFDGFKAHLDSLDATKAQWDERMAAVPEDASGYEFAIPDIDYTAMGLPEGFKLDLNAEDEDMAPLLSEMGGVLHQYGMPKEAAGALMGVLAKYEATAHLRGEKAAKEAMTEQAKLLGSKAEARISTVQRTLEQRLPKDQAAGLMSALTTAEGVKALENLLSTRALGNGGEAPRARDPEADLRAYYSTTS
jgi:hypothetical protein